MRNTALVLFLLCLPLTGQEKVVPNNEMPTYMDPSLYLAGSAKSIRNNSYTRWLASHIRLADGNISRGSVDYTPAMKDGVSMWTDYIDTEGLYLVATYFAFAAADKYGFAAENAFLHGIRDYDARYLRTNLDQFDGFEISGDTPAAPQHDPYNAVYGVMNHVRSGYEDVTRQAYCPTAVASSSSGGAGTVSRCTTFTPVTTRIKDDLLLGRQIPFYVIYVNVSVPRVDGSVDYQYWNGKVYTTLTPTSDTTNGLTQTGAIAFVPPSDWVRNMDQGTKSKYHVKVVVSGANTKPGIGRIYTDRGLTPAITETASTVSSDANGVITILTSGANTMPVGKYVLLAGFSTSILNNLFQSVVTSTSSAITIKCNLAACKNITSVSDSGTLTTFVNRGWADCPPAHQHNWATEVAYCDSPVSGSTAKVRGEARMITDFAVDQYIGNQLFDPVSGKYDWAYTKLLDAAWRLSFNPPGVNGFIWDDVGGCSIMDPKNTEYGSTPCAEVAHSFQPAMFALMAKSYPGFINGTNPFPTCEHFQNGMAGDFDHQELGIVIVGQSNPDTDPAQLVCPSKLWCPATYGQDDKWSRDKCNGNWKVGQFPNKLYVMSAYDFQRWGYLDYKNRRHMWDMAEQSPMAMLAEFHLVANPNVLFTYTPVSYQFVSGGDDYYYWVNSSATLNTTISASPSSPVVCTSNSPCAMPLTGALAEKTPISSCPHTVSNMCTSTLYLMRITNADGKSDVVAVEDYKGGATNKTSTNRYAQYGTQVFFYPHAPGDKIEYQQQDWQANVDWPHNSWTHKAYRQPIAQWGYHIPASDVYLGVPDSSSEYSAPCRRAIDNRYISTMLDCLWIDGKHISGAPGSCDAPPQLSKQGLCSPLDRRDFKGGTYGKAIVLLRTANVTTDPWGATAPSELDTPSVPIKLPGTYYQLMSDGTVDPTPLTTIQLKGREGFIGVQYPSQSDQ